MKLYYDAAYGLLFICAGLGIGYFDAYKTPSFRDVSYLERMVLFFSKLLFIILLVAYIDLRLDLTATFLNLLMMRRVLSLKRVVSVGHL